MADRTRAWQVSVLDVRFGAERPAQILEQWQNPPTSQVRFEEGHTAIVNTLNVHARTVEAR